MKIRLTCTSYLPERSPVWRGLAKVGELEIGGYGDWPVALDRANDQVALVWVLFLEDLFGWRCHQDGLEAVQDAITVALAALDRRLENADGPTIVAWLGWYHESPIRRARRRTERDRAASMFEAALWERVEKFLHLYLLSLDDLFATEGLQCCLDARNYQASRCRLSLKGMTLLAAGLEALIQRLQKPACKALVLDCDNTLWGGVVGEVGLSGLVLGQDGLGQAFVNFQHAVKSLAAAGVILAISSKNEESDVWSVFDQHRAMVLHRSDIAAARINWQEKPLQLQELAADLGIGLDSLVFWDDNPLEREKVRQALPMVVVPEPPVEIADWPAAIFSLDVLARFADTADDRAKSAQYQARAAFVDELRKTGDGLAFLASIGMRPRCVAIDESTLPRAAQLCAKTNQFNLRLARHDEATLKKMLVTAGGEAFLVALQDKFGDHGLTGLVLVVATSRSDTLFLDTFLLSCRILGRHVEAWILEQLRQRLLAAGKRYLVSEFIPGERNTPAAPFLVEHGFQPLSADTTAKGFELPNDVVVRFHPQSQRYWVDLRQWQIPYLDIFTHESSAID